jgi:hypothetical protein
MGSNSQRRLRRSELHIGISIAGRRGGASATRRRPRLLLATTAALLEENPERAQVFLKRFAKRYVAIGVYHLLRALALAEQSKLALARSVLEAHQLTNKFDALQYFPGGWTRRAWLFRSGADHSLVLPARRAIHVVL